MRPRSCPIVEAFVATFKCRHKVPASVRWRRVDTSGTDECRLSRAGSGWQLEGRAQFTHEGKPNAFHYRVRCDAEFHTLDAVVDGTADSRPVRRWIAVDEGGWRVNDEAAPALAGCTDVDLAFTPATNLLPIRRLGLGVGDSAGVAAAWLRFPLLDVRRLDQTYRRIDEDTYEYSSPNFQARLKVDSEGFVLDYPGVWTRVTGQGPWPAQGAGSLGRP